MLERLARLDTRGQPVLSVYVDLDPTRFPTPDTRASELGALLALARREGGEEEVERIRAWLEADGTIVRGARGLAIFSSARADLFETVRLPSPVEPLVIMDTVPWLEPLAAIVTPGDWGVAVVSRRGARLFRGGPRGLSEFAVIEDELHRRHAQGGWSQARFSRGIEEQVAAHVRGVATRLLRAHQRRPFERLVIVCSSELRPVVRRSLHPELLNRLAGTVDADLEHASAAEVLQAVGPLLEQAEREHEHALVVTLDDALGTGGPAAAGLDEVLSTLEHRRVDTLLVLEQASIRAGRCPVCGRLSTASEGRCPLEGATLEEVDAVVHALESAAAQSAQVVVIRHEVDWLRRHGEIAALLRW